MIPDDLSDLDSTPAPPEPTTGPCPTCGEISFREGMARTRVRSRLMRECFDAGLDTVTTSQVLAGLIPFPNPRKD